MIKVIGGTAQGGENLCATCRHAHILKGQRESSEVTICRSARSFVVPHSIATCSEYDDRRMPSKYEMEQIAWTLVTSKSGQKIGFSAPKKQDDVPNGQPGFASLNLVNIEE